MSQSQTSPSIVADLDHEQEYRLSRVATSLSTAPEAHRTSLTSTSSSLTDGPKRYSQHLDQQRSSALLGEREGESMYAAGGGGFGVGGIGDGIGGSLSTLVLGGFRKQIKKKGGSESGRSSRKRRSSCDGSASFATISSYDGGTTSASAAPQASKDEAKVEAWLQRGKADPPQRDSGCTSQSSTKPPSTPPTTRYALSLFPPASPTTGVREYLPPISPVSPISPMNNGRDAYGNHIPTNVQDYSTAQSCVGSPVLCPIAEEMTSYSMSLPNMRGGGSWWNPSSTGKEPSVIEQPNTPSRPELLQYRTPIRRTKTTSTMGHSASDARFGDRGSQATGPMRAAASTKDRAPDDWSDESDHDERLLRSDAEARRHPEPYGQSTAPAGENLLSTRDSIETLESELDSVAISFLAPIKRPESPLFEVSFDPRAHKRWNQTPATPPPGRTELPPPPPPKPKKFMSDVPSAAGMSSILKQRYDYPPSLAPSYDGDTYDYHDMQSLALGESVSVAGQPWRRNDFAARRQGVQITPEEYEASQRAAQVEFRPLCQDVMSRYNADMSRSRRAYEADQISPEQYKIQVEFNEKNKRQALKHSADESGYVILEDEPSIFRAINTPDGYAIYHDLLNTTNPAFWQRLLEQLRRAQTPQNIAATESRTSSFDQALHAVGKMARFVLATPSDPELKTFSTRMKSLDEVTADAASQNGRAKPTKSKGKVPALEPEFIDTKDFATATHSRLTGTTAVNNSRWTTAPDKHFQSYPDNAVPGPVRRHTQGAGATDISRQTMWPEGDSQDGWRDVSRPVGGSRLRGGGVEGKKKKKKGRFEWFNVSRAQAMLLHG